MIGTHLDITERKNNEERMIVTSELLNESQQLGQLGGWRLDLKTGDFFGPIKPTAYMKRPHKNLILRSMPVSIIFIRV
ncbi:MAG: hypothetical protein ACJAZP_003705 [Psychromonas sp.]|jgi:hypothetical protein|uniref:hypothetical protein n=1 Tax=Psychromonas sp. TaxID=1884585 RepID=UPI0039E6D3B5